MYHPLEKKKNICRCIVRNKDEDDGIKILVSYLQQDFNTIFKFLTYRSILVNPKCFLCQTVKTEVKCRLIRHFITVYTVCYDKNDLQGKKYILSGNLNQ